MEKTKKGKDLSKYSVEELDLMYKTMDPSDMRDCIAKEIDRRCENEKTTKSDKLKKAIELIDTKIN